MPSPYEPVEEVMRFIGAQPIGINVSANGADRLVVAERKYTWPAAMEHQDRRPLHKKRTHHYYVGPLDGGPEEFFSAERLVILPPDEYRLWNSDTPFAKREITVTDRQILQIKIWRDDPQGSL